jgi:hypothetical protein
MTFLIASPSAFPEVLPHLVRCLTRGFESSNRLLGTGAYRPSLRLYCHIETTDTAYVLSCIF